MGKRKNARRKRDTKGKKKRGSKKPSVVDYMLKQDLFSNQLGRLHATRLNVPRDGPLRHGYTGRENRSLLDDNVKPALQTGTCIIAAMFEGNKIVLAADTRVSRDCFSAFYHCDDYDLKIRSVSDKVVIAFAGTVDDANIVVKKVLCDVLELHWHIKSDVVAIRNYVEYYLRQGKPRHALYNLSTIVAGYDMEGHAHIFCVSGDISFEDKAICIGSGAWSIREQLLESLGDKMNKKAYVLDVIDSLMTTVISSDIYCGGQIKKFIFNGEDEVEIL